MKCSRNIFQLNIAGKGEKLPTCLNKKKMLRDLSLFSVHFFLFFFILLVYFIYYFTSLLIPSILFIPMFRYSLPITHFDWYNVFWESKDWHNVGLLWMQKAPLFLLLKQSGRGGRLMIYIFNRAQSTNPYHRLRHDIRVDVAIYLFFGWQYHRMKLTDTNKISYR